MVDYPAGEWLKKDCKECLGSGWLISITQGEPYDCPTCRASGYQMIWHRIEVKYIPEPYSYRIQTEKGNDHV